MSTLCVGEKHESTQERLAEERERGKVNMLSKHQLSSYLNRLLPWAACLMSSGRCDLFHFIAFLFIFLLYPTIIYCIVVC